MNSSKAFIIGNATIVYVSDHFSNPKLTGWSSELIIDYAKTLYMVIYILGSGTSPDEVNFINTESEETLELSTYEDRSFLAKLCAKALYDKKACIVNYIMFLKKSMECQKVTTFPTSFI